MEIKKKEERIEKKKEETRTRDRIGDECPGGLLSESLEKGVDKGSKGDSWHGVIEKYIFKVIPSVFLPRAPPCCSCTRVTISVSWLGATYIRVEA